MNIIKYFPYFESLYSIYSSEKKSIEDFNALLEKYKQVEDKNDTKNGMKKYLVMKLDNNNQESDFVSWKNYNATLIIVKAYEKNFNYPNKSGRVENVKRFHKELFYKIPVKISNKFISDMQKQNAKEKENDKDIKYNFGFRDVEFETVIDFHSPWLILTDDESKILIERITNHLKKHHFIFFSIHSVGFSFLSFLVHFLIKKTCLG